MRGLRRLVPVLIAAVLIGCGEGGSCWPEYDSGPPPFDYGPETITCYRFDGSEWVEDRREVFVHDDDKKILRIDRQEYIAAAWEPYGETSYYYDARGRLEAEYFYQNRSVGPGPISSRCSYYYDAGGRLESEVYTWAGGPLLEFAYSYDASGRLAAGNGTSYTYDADGRIDAVTSGYYRTLYSYDPDGRIVERREDHYIDGAWVPVRRYSYVYDMDGRVETMTYSYLPSGGDWTYVQRDTYAYHASGRLATIAKDFYDDAAGEWEPWELREFVFTEAGSSYTFEGAWYPEPFAQWILDYYGQGELNRYLW